MRIHVASDHAAIVLRGAIVAALRAKGHVVQETGPDAGEQADYPDQAAVVARSVAAGDADRGILLCGTGIGMSIAANKVPTVRAALAHDVTTARLCTEHNDANILCLGARVLGSITALDCIDAWLGATFVPRHRDRLDKIAALERG